IALEADEVDGAVNRAIHHGRNGVRADVAEVDVGVGLEAAEVTRCDTSGIGGEDDRIRTDVNRRVRRNGRAADRVPARDVVENNLGAARAEVAANGGADAGTRSERAIAKAAVGTNRCELRVFRTDVRNRRSDLLAVDVTGDHGWEVSDVVQVTWDLAG